MTETEIHTTLDGMLSNPKSKNFINHLIRAYMPITNVTKVMETPKGDFKCVITKDSLISVEGILTGMETEQFKNDFFLSLKTMFDDKADKTTPMAKLIGEKRLAVTGKDTTTYMSYPAFNEFINWVLTKSLKGDKHINWLLGAIRRSSFLDRAETIQDVEVQNKVKSIRNNSVPKTASFTLADSSDILSKFKAELESKGK